jgi:hypothetical protein
MARIRALSGMASPSVCAARQTSLNSRLAWWMLVFRLQESRIEDVSHYCWNRCSPHHRNPVDKSHQAESESGDPRFLRELLPFPCGPPGHTVGCWLRVASSRGLGACQQQAAVSGHGGGSSHHPLDSIASGDGGKNKTSRASFGGDRGTASKRYVAVLRKGEAGTRQALLCSLSLASDLREANKRCEPGHQRRCRLNTVHMAVSLTNSALKAIR